MVMKMAQSNQVEQCVLAAIVKVRVEKNRADQERFNFSLSINKKRAMDKLFFALERVEDELILMDITAKVDDLLAAAGELNSVNEKIKESIKELEDIAKSVAQAANAVKVLVDVTLALAGALA